jgi:hypothetical protein
MGFGEELCGSQSMKKVALSLLVAAGLSCAGYGMSAALPPLVASYIEVDSNPVDFFPDFIPDWHVKVPRFRKPCFGLCPERESQP